MNSPIVIQDYDLLWPQRFQTLRSSIAAVLGGLAAAIEHVGSTAVPGLAAKPVIDIDIPSISPSDLPLVINRLASLGYAHRGWGSRAARPSEPRLAIFPITFMSAHPPVKNTGGISHSGTTCEPIPRTRTPTPLSSASSRTNFVPTVRHTTRPRAHSLAKSCATLASTPHPRDWDWNFSPAFNVESSR